MNLRTAKQVGAEAVREAGEMLMKHFERLHKAKFKQKHDIVTKMDVQVEKLLMDRIREEFPDHNILTEESGAHYESSEYTWLVDPIDGTINYFHASPPFRVAMCLVKDKVPILSFIYNPIKEDLYVAEKGKGATKNGKRLRVSNNQSLARTIVMTHISSHINARARTLLALGSIFRKVLHIRVIGCGTAAITYIADAKFDVFFNISTNSWDILPGALLIEEAQGKATDISGGKLTIESTSILATNSKLHNKMLELLKKV